MNDRSRTVEEAINGAPLGKVQWRVILLCAAVAMLDGFDTQAVAFVAPVISKQWDIPPGEFGWIFSAGLGGIMIGQLFVAPLADRYGRRPLIVLSAALFGLFMLSTAAAIGFKSLLAMRFATGIWLGAATPNLIALTAELSPVRLRSTLITSMFAGFPIGAALGGYLSTFLIPAMGWQSVFYLGGAIPLLLLVPLIYWLVESPQFLATQRGKAEELGATLSKLGIPSTPARDVVQLSSTPEPRQIGGLASLFRGGLARITTALWVTYFCSLLTIYFLMSWIPTIANQAGMSLDVAIFTSVVLNLGGAIGGVMLGLMADKFGSFPVLCAGYFAAGCAIMAAGMAMNAPAVLIALIFAAGLFVVGGQTAMNAAVTALYPAHIRATGLGSALAVGRVGSIVGPLLGGMLLVTDMSLSAIFVLFGVPAIVVAIVFVTLMRGSAQKQSQPEGSYG